MGLLLGKITVETPKYEVVLLRYSPSVIAEVTYDPSRGDREGFMILAGYIGAVGQPQNAKPEKIAMTAPVITMSAPAERISMTAPVITSTAGGDGVKTAVTMQFVLPSMYGSAVEAPRPVDDRVAIREEGERKYGVVRFSGVATDGAVAEKVEKLRQCLERDGHKVAGDHILARYNPPWTLPPLRTNEVMIPVE